MGAETATHQPLEFFMPPNQQAKKGITVLAGAINSNYKVGEGLVLHSKGREDYVWKPRDFLGNS